MTVRNTKRLIVLALVLMIIAAGLNIFVAVTRTDHRVEYLPIAMPLFVFVLFIQPWRRLSALEAEHGPDYVQPQPPYATKVLAVATGLAVVVATVLAYLVFRR